MSNFSSTSFVCDVTGDTESGMNFTLSDAEMSECVCKHTICNNMLLPEKQLTHDDYREIIHSFYELEGKSTDWHMDSKAECIKSLETNDYARIDEILELHSEYNIPAYRCPICSFKHFIPKDVLDYIYKTKLNITEVQDEIISKFKTYTDFVNFELDRSSHEN